MAIADDVEAILARRNPAAARRARQAAARAAVAAREGRAGLAIPEAPLAGRFNGQAVMNPMTATGGGGDMLLDNISIAVSQVVNITTFTLTAGGA